MKLRWVFLCLVVSLLANAQTYTASTLVSFPPNTGKNPIYPGDVTLDSKGNMYGTSSGGTPSGTLFPNGTIFEVSRSGKLTVLHFFDGADGSDPRGGVTRDSKGNLYGTTFSGGAFQYYGTIYRLAPDGTETVLYSFSNAFPQGNYPSTNLTLEGNGNIFGYTSYTDNNFNVSDGAVFELAKSDTFAIRYLFGGLNYGDNGAGPVGQPLLDKSGNFYGATCCDGSAGNGTVFRLTPEGMLTTLYSFNIFADKVYQPIGNVVEDASGNLYGVGYGGIYEVLASGGEKVFYLAPKGTDLEQTLTIDSEGNLYGTSQYGGTNGTGAVYMVSPEGVETDLYSSLGPTLNAGVAIDQEGNLYVTESRGGTNNTGAVIKLTKNAD
jgi:uncharacterized repeat protein (TIGR03803 family)